MEVEDEVFDPEQIADDALGLTEKAEISWMAMLDKFMEDIWPLFQKHGFSKEGAFMIWQNNAIKNAIYSVEETIEDHGIDS